MRNIAGCMPEIAYLYENFLAVLNPYAFPLEKYSPLLFRVTV